MNHAAANTRYGLFSPMEVSIIFHFASRGNGNRRLALIDFAQLLDPRWQAPTDVLDTVPPEQSGSVLLNVAHSAYNFVLGGFAGAIGATMVYPIDLGGCVTLEQIEQQLNQDLFPCF
jgi:solute carrier family 25 aspartate/glutamate transporter 12/13